MIKDILAILGSAGKITEMLADPKRREEVKLRLAIEAAENLLAINDKSGEYADMDADRASRWKRHWLKRWKKYKDGV